MHKTKNLVQIALSAAFIAVCAWLTIPGPVPFTMQTMAVLTVAGLLGAGKGCAAVGVYLLLGAVGAPVFHGFQGGAQVLVGPTGGYLIGFVFTALLVGWAVRRFQKLWQMVLFMALGILICYAFGTAWFMAVYTRGGNAVTLGGALSMCVLPYLIPDGIKIVLAAALVKRLWPVASKELIPA